MISCSASSNNCLFSISLKCCGCPAYVEHLNSRKCGWPNTRTHAASKAPAKTLGIHDFFILTRCLFRGRQVQDVQSFLYKNVRLIDNRNYSFRCILDMWELGDKTDYSQRLWRKPVILFEISMTSKRFINRRLSDDKHRSNEQTEFLMCLW